MPACNGTDESSAKSEEKVDLSAIILIGIQPSSETKALRRDSFFISITYYKTGSFAREKFFNYRKMFAKIIRQTAAKASLPTS